MKIALFGGAFDPITKGHIKVCNYLIDKHIVDEVWLMPCYVSYYGKKMATCDDRLRMCQLAVEHNKNSKVKVSDYEIANKLTGESIDIIKKLQADHKDQFYFVIGMDNAIKITGWTDWEVLIGLIPFIVMPRSGYTLSQTDSSITPIAPTAWFMKDPHIYLADYEANIMSSTQVRDDLRTKKSCDLIDDPVSDYIKSNTLYE